MKKILILFAILIFSGKASADVTINGAGSGSGDITGPSSVTSGSIAAFDGTTGNVLKEAADVAKFGASTAISDGDATPNVSTGHRFKTANTSPTSITGFDFGGGAITNGWPVCILVNDSDTTFDFTSSNLVGISADYTGVSGEEVCFDYDSTDTKWHHRTSAEAVETLATSGVVVNNAGTPTTVTNATKSADYTVGTDNAAECYGGMIYVTSTATITACDNLANGMNFCVATVGAIAVSADVQSDDLQYLDGVALDDGDKATNTSTTGDIICFSYYDSTGWWSVSGSPDGDHWTDGGP